MKPVRAFTAAGGAAAAEGVLVDPEAADARLQRARRHTERLRRAAVAIDTAAARLEGLFDLLTLVGGTGARRTYRPGRGGEARKLEVGEAEQAPASEDHRALDDVLQLADVSGPAIPAEHGHRRLVDPLDRLADLARVLARPVLGKERDVLGPLPQRRHPDREHVEPEEQVRAEPAFADRFLQVPVGGCHDAGVRPQRLMAAHALELALLQHAQEGDLDRRRQLAHLVEEDRAPGGQLEAALAALQSAGEGSPLVAEQL